MICIISFNEIYILKQVTFNALDIYSLIPLIKSREVLMRSQRKRRTPRLTDDDTFWYGRTRIAFYFQGGVSRQDKRFQRTDYLFLHNLLLNIFECVLLKQNVAGEEDTSRLNIQQAHHSVKHQMFGSLPTGKVVVLNPSFSLHDS